MGKIIIKQGDITWEEVDVIVNAANSTLRGGGGVDGAIHRAAGESVLSECIKMDHCLTGECVITNAGRLKAKKIIHAVGPVWSGGTRGEAQLLKNCYRKSLELALAHNLKTIAFPAISTGAYRYPIEAATEIALTQGFQFKEKFDCIIFVCFSRDDLAIYQSVYERMANDENKTLGSG
ncbi:MAG TPA: macro domain-containing protein [Candidatus Omnitrophota bacterium]|nr:macro domain-containing protein [Candidatus Omnitrophota bacterium]HPD85445.1 macro domain-containing protein [Candidatus Omnitrophota bacterium]HRZ04054.1 macro domain-containing protein [Candidatus Omnitrophota bacterium]